MKESGRFLEKAAQKLLTLLGHGRCRRHCPRPSIKKFFCFFLFTKRSLPPYSPEQVPPLNSQPSG
jgi:hypothetical protein